MKEQTFSPDLAWPAASPIPRGHRIARRLVLGKLKGLTRGQLILQEQGRRMVFGRPHAALPVTPVVVVNDPAVYARVAWRGTIGAGEAYMEGLFDCRELTALMQLFALNREAMAQLEGGTGLLRRGLDLLWHRLRWHDRRGSRRNIEAHYDLGNDFFSTFLDREAMMYSMAVFPHPEASLEEASRHKLALLCRKLDLRPEHHLLEIGTGWGGLAIHAARHHGCRVTTATISPAQHRHATAQVARAGLAHRVTVLLADYRDLQGQYDRLVSVEMIEAIGHRQYGEFFETCARLLKPDGRMALQAITIDDRFYEQAKRTVDFIQRYIFPGGCLPSLGVLCATAGTRSDLAVEQVQEYGLHYATTLRHWRTRLHDQWGRLRGLGYDEHFLRLWDFYFAYCEGGFLTRTTGTVQMVLTKPEAAAGPGGSHG